MLVAAIAAPAPLFASDSPRGQDLSAYVRARAADADGAAEVAARGYDMALTADPQNEVIAIRAFREGMSVGDFALARRALTVLEASEVAPADAALLRFADEVKARQWDAASASADRMAKGPLDFVGPILKAWIALESGKLDSAALSQTHENAVARRYSAEQRALILVASGRTEEAKQALSALLGGTESDLDLRVAAARLFAGKGDTRTAKALLAGNDPVATAYRESLGRGMKPSAAFGANVVFTRLAADLSVAEPSPIVILLTRMALLLDPGNDRAKLLLADALSQDGAGGRALALVDEVKSRSPLHELAVRQRIVVLDRMGRDDEAIMMARKLAETRGAGADDATQLGDLLVSASRFDEAAAAYAMAMERDPERADWALNLQRGGALEQAGRFDQALPFLKRAVELAPDEPVALNYLGYAQIERGLNLADAQALLEKARSLKPDDPSIVDSLGWAYVRRGQIAKAVPLLEQAAKAEPGDVTINEHLGDAYWHAGRRYEARYAWRAASVHAEGDDATRLTQKLSRGLIATNR